MICFDEASIRARLTTIKPKNFCVGSDDVFGFAKCGKNAAPVWNFIADGVGIMKSEIAAVLANGLSCAGKQDRRFSGG